MKPTLQSEKPKVLTALNIRAFPDDLRWRLRERAGRERMSLRDFVIASLQRATEEEVSAYR